MSIEKIKNYFAGHFNIFYEKYLQKVKKIGNGKEYSAKCPFHEDTNPSLNFNNENGLYYCHGCNESGDIITFFAKWHNLEAQKDFPKIVKQIAEDFGISETQPKLVKTYDYVDENGNLLFQVCRYEPKTFRQRHQDGSGKWINNMDGVRRVLYRLPDVINAAEVLIVEGEKDADHVSKLGFCGTTCPMGAKKWRPEYSECLKAKDIILIPDNDEQGRKHMHDVASSLKDHAASIRWLNLPDLQAKGDVSDFIATFTDKNEAAERLAIMIDGAASYESPEDVSTLKETTESETDLLNFPDIMSGAAGAFADVYSSYMEPPKHFFYLAYLTCLGNVLTKKLTIDSELLPEPRLYVVLIGASADDRKSTAISKTTSFFEETVSDFSVCHGVGSAEGLQIKLKKSPKVVLCFDEFKAFVSKCKIESSVLLPCVTTLFESDRYEAHTVKNSITIDNASLSILAACTIDTYEQIIDTHFQAIGFPNRLFLVPGHGNRRFAVPKRIPDDEKKILKNRLREVLDFVGEELVLEITDAAFQIYNEWYMKNLPQSVHTKRLDTYAMRFMGLLAVNDLKKEIDEETVRKAIALCDWQYQVRKRHDPIDADNVMARLEEKIRRVLRTGPKTNRDLKKAVNSHRYGVWMFDTAINNLMKAGQVNKKGKKYFLVINEVPSDLPSLE